MSSIALTFSEIVAELMYYQQVGLNLDLYQVIVELRDISTSINQHFIPSTFFSANSLSLRVGGFTSEKYWYEKVLLNEDYLIREGYPYFIGYLDPYKKIKKDEKFSKNIYFSYEEWVKYVFDTGKIISPDFNFSSPIELLVQNSLKEKYPITKIEVDMFDSLGEYRGPKGEDYSTACTYIVLVAEDSE